MNNIIFMRHIFFTCKQDGQSFDEFVTALKKHSAECVFKTVRDDHIRDLTICGINR